MTNQLTDEEIARADEVRKVLATLPPRDELIMRMHFGIGQSAPMSEAEIAAAKGFKEEDVRAAIDRGLRHVRANLKK